MKRRAYRASNGKLKRVSVRAANEVSKLKQLVQAIESDVRWVVAKARVLDDQDGIDASDVAHYFARKLKQRVKELEQI